MGDGRQCSNVAVDVVAFCFLIVKPEGTAAVKLGSLRGKYV